MRWSGVHKDDPPSVDLRVRAAIPLILHASCFDVNLDGSWISQMSCLVYFDAQRVFACRSGETRHHLVHSFQCFLQLLVLRSQPHSWFFLLSNGRFRKGSSCGCFFCKECVCQSAILMLTCGRSGTVQCGGVTPLIFLHVCCSFPMLSASTANHNGEGADPKLTRSNTAQFCSLCAQARPSSRRVPSLGDVGHSACCRSSMGWTLYGMSFAPRVHRSRVDPFGGSHATFGASLRRQDDRIKSELIFTVSCHLDTCMMSFRFALAAPKRSHAHKP